VEQQKQNSLGVIGRALSKRPFDDDLRSRSRIGCSVDHGYVVVAVWRNCRAHNLDRRSATDDINRLRPLRSSGTFVRLTTRVSRSPRAANSSVGKLLSLVLSPVRGTGVIFFRNQSCHCWTGDVVLPRNRRMIVGVLGKTNQLHTIADESLKTKAWGRTEQFLDKICG
jgi:hypothetical protein